jgi:hypothetical protein
MLHIVSDKFHVVWTSKDCEDLLISSHTDYEQALNAADNLIQDSYSYRLFPKGHVRISHSHAFNKWLWIFTHNLIIISPSGI